MMLKKKKKASFLVQHSVYVSAPNKDIPIHTAILSPDRTYFWNVSDFKFFC